MLVSSFTVTADPDGAELDIVLPDDRSSPAEPGSLFILVEALDGEGGDFRVEGTVVERLPSEDPAVQIFAGAVRELESLSLRLFSGIRRRFRVFVGWVKGRVGELWKKLPCKGCVMAIRAAVKAGLAALGVPFLDADRARVAAERITDLANIPSLPALEPIADFMERLFGERVWGWIWAAVAGAIDPLVEVLRMADSFFRELCTMLGFCSNEQAEAGA